MNPALWAAKTGLDAQQTRMAVTSNNLANVTTTGFKKGRAVFEDLLYQNMRQVGASTSQDTEAPTGLVARHRCARRGDREELHPGQSAADRQFARRGDQRSRLFPGTAAGRHARLHARWRIQGQPEGELVTSSGYALQPGITIPDGAQSISIGKDGTVSRSQLAGQSAPTQVGALQLFDFINPAGLQPRGENMLRRIRSQRHCLRPVRRA